MNACMRVAYKANLKRLAAVLGPRVPRAQRKSLQHLAKNAAARACGAGGRPPGVALGRTRKRRRKARY